MIEDFPTGESCFIDANILGYASVEILPFTASCRSFLGRVAAGEIFAFTSANAVADALFNTMMVEISAGFVPPGTKALAFVQNHPEVIRRLLHYPKAVEGLAKLPLRLLSLDWDAIQAGMHISVEQGLLTNDAMIVALMRRHQLSHLITNDDDFDAVPGLTIWKPR